MQLCHSPKYLSLYCLCLCILFTSGFFPVRSCMQVENHIGEFKGHVWTILSSFHYRSQQLCSRLLGPCWGHHTWGPVIFERLDGQYDSCCIPLKLQASIPSKLMAALAMVVLPTSGSPYNITTGAPPFSSTNDWKCKFIARALNVKRAETLLCWVHVSNVLHSLLSEWSLGGPEWSDVAGMSIGSIRW